MSSATTNLRFPSVGDASGRTLGEVEIEALRRVIKSGRLGRWSGNEVAQLEAEFARLLGVGYSAASTSGTSAIHLAVAAVNPEPGDEIIVTPITDFGTVAGILAQNAIPVFADVDPVTGCLTPESVASKLSDRTRAVIVVHLFGGGARIDEISTLCADQGITVIEDCAQAYLTVPPGGETFAGSRATIGCFSLQQSKHITSGDGGLTVTSDADLDQRMRLFSDKGWPRTSGERTHLFYGLNYRMTELQGAVARAQLCKLHGVVASRRKTAANLISRMSDLPGLTTVEDAQHHSFWQFPIVLDTAIVPFDNRAYASAVSKYGVPISSGYLDRVLYLVPAIRDRQPYGTSRFPYTVPPSSREIEYGPGDCPVAENLVGRTLLVIPWNEHYTEEHVDALAMALTGAYESLA